MKKYLSEIEMLIQGIYVSGKAWQIEADKLCNDSKTLQDYMRHVEQQSQVAKHMHRQLRFIVQPQKSCITLVSVQNVARRSY